MSDSPPATGRSRRPATALLFGLMALSGALVFWYLPAADRQDVEGPGIENVEAKLAGGEIPHPGALPVAWAPQLLAIAAADRLHDANGGAALHVVTAKGRLTRRGRDTARYFSLLYGVAGLYFLYRIGRRLHSPAVALLAVLILGLSPWHLQASVLFAPDILVLCLATLALWLGLRALDRPSAIRLGLVGLALAAAAAAKPVGAFVAVPVLLALIFGGGRRPARMLRPVAIALPVALVVWWLLIPSIQLLADALGAQQAAEAGRVVREASSRFTVAVLGFLHPLRESVHGRLIGSLALLGAAGQAFRCLFLVEAGPDRAHRLMVLAAAPALIVGTAVLTPIHREGGFVPLLPLSSLYAAVMLAVLWESLTSLVPRLGSPRTAAVAAVLVAAVVVPPGWTYVHSKAVGSTIGVALDWLRKDLRPGQPRLLAVEEAALGGGAETVSRLAGGIGVRVVSRLASLDEGRLADLDGEIFLRAELDGADGAFYRRRIEGPGGHRVVRGSLLRRRGPDLVVVSHSYGGRPAEELILALERRSRAWRAAVPATAVGAAISLVLELPPTVETEPVAPRARLGGTELELLPAGRLPRHTLFVTERLPGAPEPRRLEVETPPWMSARRGELKVAMYLWRSPGPKAAEP